MPDGDRIPLPDDLAAPAAPGGPFGPPARPSVLPPPRPDRRAGRPWGPWATLGFTVVWFMVAIAVSAVATLVVITIVAIAAGALRPHEARLETLQAFGGLIVGLVEILTTPALVGLTVLLAWVRMPVAEYLALRRPSYRDTILWLLGFLGLMVAQDVFSVLISRPIVPEVQLEAYRTAYFLPMLVVALVVSAPLIEELFFRGFMYKGLAASKVGVAGAIILTAFVWAAIHFQYDWVGRGVIFADGIVLGLVRWRTRSIALPVLLHAIMNAVATVQTVILAHGWI